MKKATQTLLNRAVGTLATDGRGVVRPDADAQPPHPVIFVPKALPGELIDLQIHTQHRTYWEGIAIRQISSTETRVEPTCAIAHSCGGCSLQHLSSKVQPDWKRTWFLETLRRVGRWPENAQIQAEQLLQIIAAPQWQYRQRIRLHCERSSVGFHHNNSNRIVPAARGDLFCPIAHPLIRNNWDKVATVLERFMPFENSFELEITAGNVDSKLHFLLFTSGSKRGQTARHQKLIEALRSLDCASSEENISIPHPFLDKFSVAREGFIQPHTEAMNLYSRFLFDAIRGFTSKHTPNRIDENTNKKMEWNAWDLYAGSGPFSPIPHLVLQHQTVEATSSKADQFNVHIHAVEGHAGAALSLKKNCASFPVTIHNHAVETFLDGPAKNLPYPNVVITDPPRDGMGIETTNRLADRLLASEGEVLVLMVSCSPASFARDGAILSARGFQLDNLALFDCFGQTHHYEVIGGFVRRMDR